MASIQTLSPEQEQINELAVQDLVPGRYYDFKPPVEATGIPTGGPSTCHASELRKILTFSRGWYLGYVEKKHVFQGKPINDSRVILTPYGCGDAPNLDEIKEQLRTCYFHVAFLGGSKAIVSDDQSPD